jgi:hypothetical protein
MRRGRSFFLPIAIAFGDDESCLKRAKVETRSGGMSVRGAEGGQAWQPPRIIPVRWGHRPMRLGGSAHGRREA